MNWNSGVLKTCRLPLVSDLRDAAPGDEQDQRGDDRLDAEAGDQPAVEQAEHAGDQHRHDEGERDADVEAAAAGTAVPRKISGASAPAIAISEPTDRSMPPVAITSVMPTADDDDGADLGEIDVERLPGGEVRRDTRS